MASRELALSVLDAAALVGLLADEPRRRVVAALILGSSSATDLAASAELDQHRLWKAIGRLVDAGLVQVDDGAYRLDADAFAAAARAAALQRAEEDAAADAGAGQPPEVARVLRAFVRDGRLVSIPVARSKRLVVLDLLAQDFEPGRRYSESMVNLTLGQWHPDTASLRRYLVDEGFLDRSEGQYWRSGGSVPSGSHDD